MAAMIEVSGMQQDLLKSAQETSQLIESVGHPQAADIGGTSAESGPDVLTKVTELLDFATNEVRGCCVALTADYVH